MADKMSDKTVDRQVFKLAVMLNLRKGGKASKFVIWDSGVPSFTPFKSHEKSLSSYFWSIFSSSSLALLTR